MLRRTGEEEEASGDCMARVPGFDTGGVVGGRRRIARVGGGGDRGFWLGRSCTCRSAVKAGWVLPFPFYPSFLFVYLKISKFHTQFVHK